MSKAILVVDIDDGIDLSEVEIEYYVYEIPKIFCCHGIPFGKKIIKAGGVYSPKPLPEKKEKLKGRGKDHCEYSLLDQLEYRKGFNDCLDEILGGNDD